jgi:prevent-host-death family protein
VHVPKVSKSAFKAKALEWFRRVERTGEPVLITSHGKPVLRVVRYAASGGKPASPLRGSVQRYDRPTAPVSARDWEAV